MVQHRDLGGETGKAARCLVVDSVITIQYSKLELLIAFSFRALLYLLSFDFDFENDVDSSRLGYLLFISTIQITFITSNKRSLIVFLSSVRESGERES